MLTNLFAEKLDQTFEELLEQYVFKASVLFIDQADTAMQARLIKLYRHTGNRQHKKAKRLHAVTRGLCQHRVWKRSVLTKQLMATYQTKWKDILSYLNGVNQQLELFCQTNKDPLLVNHFQALKNRYEANLITLLVWYQRELSKLRH